MFTKIWPLNHVQRLFSPTMHLHCLIKIYLTKDCCLKSYSKRLQDCNRVDCGRGQHLWPLMGHNFYRTKSWLIQPLQQIVATLWTNKENIMAYQTWTEIADSRLHSHNLWACPLWERGTLSSSGWRPSFLQANVTHPKTSRYYGSRLDDHINHSGLLTMSKDCGPRPARPSRSYGALCGWEEGEEGEVAGRNAKGTRREVY